MICSQVRHGPPQASTMSNRSFVDRAADEGGQRLVVFRVVSCAARPFGSGKAAELGVEGSFQTSSLALPLHRIEIVHIGLVGLVIVTQETHWLSRPLRF